MSRRMSEHLPAALDEARLLRQWSAVEAGLEARRTTGRGRLAWSAGAAAVVLLASAWLYRGLPGAGAARLPQGALVGSELEPVQAALADGSELTLRPRSRLRVERVAVDEVRLELLQGGADFDVASNPRRRFRVVAGAAHVDVIGTRFRAVRIQAQDGPQLRVTVQRGVVEVARSDGRGGVRRLVAGEQWSIAISGAEPAPDPPSQPPPREPAAPREPQALQESPSEARDAPRSRPREVEPSEPAQVDSASRMFAEANLARRAGRIVEAEAGYAQLVAQHPTDSRAGLAAFELGRLRMDALGDPRGAVEALQTALDDPSSGAFREDAMARLVLAYDALHDPGACRRARERYLSRYPGGVHVAALSVRCDSK